MDLNFDPAKAQVFRGLFNLLEKKGGKSLAQLQLAAVSKGYRISSAWPNVIPDARDVPVCPFPLCAFASEWGIQVLRHSLHKLPKDSGEQGHSCTSLAVLRPTPKESSLLLLHPCTGSEHHAVHPLPARVSDHPAQHPCLKHWSNMGAAQQPGRKSLGEAVTHLPSQHSSMPSLPCPWHADTSTHTFKGLGQKNVVRFVCITHGLT